MNAESAEGIGFRGITVKKTVIGFCNSSTSREEEVSTIADYKRNLNWVDIGIDCLYWFLSN